MRVTVQISKENKEKLDELVKETGTSQSYIINKLVGVYNKIMDAERKYYN